MRLRSPATLIAVLAFVAAAFFWIPDPHGTATSLSWELPDGRVQAPLYTAEYVGLAISILSGIFLAMGGFYLVAGSVRRDRERNVGAILAATPLSKTAYLGGKFAAHFVYLFVLATLGLAAGLVAFLRFGTGPFSLADFTLPYSPRSSRRSPSSPRSPCSSTSRRSCAAAAGWCCGSSSSSSC